MQHKIAEVEMCLTCLECCVKYMCCVNYRCFVLSIGGVCK